jgi:hypothetical protein
MTLDDAWRELEEGLLIVFGKADQLLTSFNVLAFLPHGTPLRPPQVRVFLFPRKGVCLHAPARAGATLVRRRGESDAQPCSRRQSFFLWHMHSARQSALTCQR